MKLLPITLILVFLATAIKGQEASEVPKKADYPSLAQQAIARAGANKAQLEKAIEGSPAEQKEAMQYLIAHMPVRDLESLTADFLLVNVSLAYKARAEFPWARDVPKDIFYNDVLPYAVLNETRDNWRPDFYKRFRKYVKEAKTMEEAVLAINKVIRKEVGVEYSTNRKKPHQSPYESMEIKMASCTGLSIILNDAFRAVGIPSRVAGIPMWTTKKGNHNWVEYWSPTDGKWHFTEYHMDAQGVDHAWFLADAARSDPQSVLHSVYATSWERREIHFPMVWSMRDRSVPGVNVSERYIELGSVGEKQGENSCELRVDYTAGGRRTAIPVVIIQGDVEISRGLTPDRSKDMNQFLTIEVRKGQIYQIKYMLPGSSKWKTREVKTDDEAEFLRLQLEIGKAQK